LNVNILHGMVLEVILVDKILVGLILVDVKFEEEDYFDLKMIEIQIDLSWERK